MAAVQSSVCHSKPRKANFWAGYPGILAGIGLCYCWRKDDFLISSGKGGSCNFLLESIPFKSDHSNFSCAKRRMRKVLEAIIKSNQGLPRNESNKTD